MPSTETPLQKVLRLSGRSDPGFIELFNQNHDSRGEFSTGGGATAVMNNPSNFDFGKLARGETQAGIGGLNIHPSELPIHVIDNLSDVDLAVYHGRVKQALTTASSMHNEVALGHRLDATTAELAKRGLGGPPGPDGGIEAPVPWPPQGMHPYVPNQFGIPSMANPAYARPSFFDLPSTDTHGHGGEARSINFSNPALDKVTRLARR
jgi:hypothetical protein